MSNGCISLPRFRMQRVGWYTESCSKVVRYCLGSSYTFIELSASHVIKNLYFRIPSLCFAHSNPASSRLPTETLSITSFLTALTYLQNAIGPVLPVSPFASNVMFP